MTLDCDHDLGHQYQNFVRTPFLTLVDLSVKFDYICSFEL